MRNVRFSNVARWQLCAGRASRVDFDPVYYNTAGEFILEGGVAAIPGNFSIGGTLTVTGQATFNGGFANPAALRNASNLNIDALTAHGDSACTILTTDRVVATSAAFTASRTWTLPAANAVNPGQSLTITDEANGITSTNSLVVSRAGSDSIVAQGTNVSTITLSSGGALITLISDGSNKWIVQSLRQAPQVSVFTSGSSQTYTTPIGALYLKLRIVGGGGGGGAANTNAGSVGTDTSFGTWTAIHGNGGAIGSGQGGLGGAGGTGGVNGTGTVITRVDGATGNGGISNTNNYGGAGGSSVFGGAGAAVPSAGAGTAAKTNTGSGGSGASPSGAAPAGGGGAGEFVEAMIAAPATTYTYTVGAGGNGGAAGGTAGGNGAAGRIEVTAYFQ